MDSNLFKSLQDCFASTAQDAAAKGKPVGCGWNEISFLAQNILQALIYIGLFAAGCMVAYAGWLLLSKGGSNEARTKAKKIFKNIVLGLILLLGAYFIVDLILTQIGVTPEYRKGFVEPGTQ